MTERMATAGLDILNMEGHSSGNPVPWDIEAGAGAKEYFSMIHVKKGDYAHWAVRIDKASRRVTHVSSGPLIKARDYRNEVLPTCFVCECLTWICNRSSPMMNLAMLNRDKQLMPSSPAAARGRDECSQHAGTSHVPDAIQMTGARLRCHHWVFYGQERSVCRALQGFLQTALVVSSFHVLDMEAADGVVERTVRILYGEGDRYGCWLDVLADNIVWHELSDPAALPASQLDADTHAEEVGQHPAIYRAAGAFNTATSRMSMREAAEQFTPAVVCQ